MPDLYDEILDEEGGLENIKQQLSAPRYANHPRAKMILEGVTSAQARRDQAKQMSGGTLYPTGNGSSGVASAMGRSVYDTVVLAPGAISSGLRSGQKGLAQGYNTVAAALEPLPEGTPDAPVEQYQGVSRGLASGNGIPFNRNVEEARIAKLKSSPIYQALAEKEAFDTIARNKELEHRRQTLQTQNQDVADRVDRNAIGALEGYSEGTKFLQDTSGVIGTFMVPGVGPVLGPSVTAGMRMGDVTASGGTAAQAVSLGTQQAVLDSTLAKLGVKLLPKAGAGAAVGIPTTGSGYVAANSLITQQYDPEAAAEERSLKHLAIGAAIGTGMHSVGGVGRAMKQREVVREQAAQAKAQADAVIEQQRVDAEQAAAHAENMAAKQAARDEQHMRTTGDRRVAESEQRMANEQAAKESAVRDREAAVEIVAEKLAAERAQRIKDEQVKAEQVARDLEAQRQLDAEQAILRDEAAARDLEHEQATRAIQEEQGQRQEAKSLSEKKAARTAALDLVDSHYETKLQSLRDRQAEGLDKPAAQAAAKDLRAWRSEQKASLAVDPLHKVVYPEHVQKVIDTPLERNRVLEQVDREAATRENRVFTKDRVAEEAPPKYTQEPMPEGASNRDLMSEHEGRVRGDEPIPGEATPRMIKPGSKRPALERVGATPKQTEQVKPSAEPMATKTSNSKPLSDLIKSAREKAKIAKANKEMYDESIANAEASGSIDAIENIKAIRNDRLSELKEKADEIKGHIAGIRGSITAPTPEMIRMKRNEHLAEMSGGKLDHSETEGTSVGVYYPKEGVTRYADRKELQKKEYRDELAGYARMERQKYKRDRERTEYEIEKLKKELDQVGMESRSIKKALKIDQARKGAVINPADIAIAIGRQAGKAYRHARYLGIPRYFQAHREQRNQAVKAQAHDIQRDLNLFKEEVAKSGLTGEQVLDILRDPSAAKTPLQQQFRDRVDDLSTELSKYTNKQTSDDILNNLGRYLNDSFAVNDKIRGPDWEKNVPKKVREDFIDELMEKNAKDPSYTRENAESQANTILRAYRNEDPVSLIGNDSSNGILKRKEVLTPAHRALLGPESDPSIVLGRTLTKQKELVEAKKFRDNIVSEGMGKYFFKHSTDNVNGTDYNVKLDLGDHKHVYTSQAIANHLRPPKETGVLKKAADHLNKAFGTSLWGQTVGNPVNFAGRQALQNLMALASNGHVPWVIPGPGYVEGNLNVMKAVKTYMDPTDPGRHDFITEMIADGIIKPHESSARTQENFEYDTIEKPRYKVVPGDNIVSKAANKTIDIGRKGIHKTGEFTATPDHLMKIVAYETLKARLKATRPDLNTTAKIERAASDIIKETYYNTDNLPAILKYLRYLPGAKGFISFALQTPSIAKHQVLRTAEMAIKGNAAGKYMAAQNAATLAAVLSAPSILDWASASHHEISKEEQDELRKSSKFNKFSSILWTGRDKDGNPTGVDISYVDPQSYLRSVYRAITDDGPKNKPTTITDKLYNVGGVLASPFGSPGARSIYRGVEKSFDESASWKEVAKTVIEGFTPGIIRVGNKAVNEYIANDPEKAAKIILDGMLAVPHNMNVDVEASRKGELREDDKIGLARETEIRKEASKAGLTLEQAKELADIEHDRNIAKVGTIAGYRTLGANTEKVVRALRKTGNTTKETAAIEGGRADAPDPGTMVLESKLRAMTNLIPDDGLSIIEEFDALPRGEDKNRFRDENYDVINEARGIYRYYKRAKKALTHARRETDPARKAELLQIGHDSLDEMLIEAGNK